MLVDVDSCGPCCVCECDGPTVRNVLMLHMRGPAGFKGWGCLVCDLPHEGALAVVCDACIERHRQDVGAHLKFMCGGEYIAQKVRVSYPPADMTRFDCDLEIHEAALQQRLS